MHVYLIETLGVLQGLDSTSTTAWIRNVLERKISLPVGMPGDDVTDVLGDVIQDLNQLGSNLQFQSSMEELISHYVDEGNVPILRMLNHVAACDKTDKGKELFLRIEGILGIKRCPPDIDIDEWLDKYDHGEKK